MRILVFVLTLIALATLIGLLSWTSRHPAIAVDEVRVVGAKELSKNELEAFSESILHEKEGIIFSRENMFLYPKRRIEKEIVEAFPRAMTASVSLASFKDPSLVVNIEERVAFALWCNEENTCFFIDRSGFIFAEADGVSPQSGMPIFKGGIVGNNPIGVSFLPNHFTRIYLLINEVEHMGIDVADTRVVNDDDYEINDAHGMSLKVRFVQTNEEIISNLRAILGSSALQGGSVEYIDLRFGNRVYYKLRK